MREAQAEGKIKGRGTSVFEKPVCTWGWRGTRLGRQRAARRCNALSALTNTRASPFRLRWPWMEVLREPQ